MELRFTAANEKIRRLPFDNKDLERGHPRWKMYGLSKQVTEGDCKVDCPPAENYILTSKWQAWQAMRGKSREQAISEFLTEYDRYEAGSSSNSSPAPAPVPQHPRSSLISNASALAPSVSSHAATKRGSILSIQGVIKEGVLYKQRDLFKGWRPRKFVLQEGFLHYYYDQDDVSPRRSMDIAGCKVAAEKPGKFGENDQELFPFVISHIKASKVYTLAADSKEESDDWIAKISLAAQAAESGGAAGAAYSSGAGSSSILDSSSPADSSSKFRALNPDATLANIPQRILPKLERAVAALVESVDPTAPNWEPMFEKQGIIAKKRSGDVVCVRGDGNVPFALPDVLSAIVNADGLVDVDTQLQSSRLLKAFSSNTGVHHLKYKAVWPANARDVVCLNHWRLLSDSRVVSLAFSEKFDELVSPDEGTVRAELILGGYVLTPISSTETLVQYVVQIDMKANLASGMLSLISNSQPLNVYNIKKKLQTTFQSSKSLYAGRIFTFDDLLEATDINGSGDGKASKGTSSASASVSTAATTAAPVTAAATAPIAAAPAVAPSTPASSSAAPVSSKPSFIQNVKSAFSGGKRNKSKTAKISTLSLCVLLLPSLLHYIVGNQYRALVFMLSLLFSLRYVLMLHLGSPDRKPPTRGAGQLAQGRTLIRFPAELGKILRFIQSKSEETGVDMTMTHVAVKAAAAAIREMPYLNGHLLFGKFYRTMDVGIDVSVVADVPDLGSLLLKVADAERKPVEFVANELQQNIKSLSDTKKSGVLSKREEILRKVGPFVAAEIESWLAFFGSQLGLTIPALNVTAFPAGCCSILTAPKGNDTDMDIALVPHVTDTSAPITITIGGIRILPSLDAERKVAGNPVLNIAIAIDTRAATLTEAHRFTSVFQHYMNNPTFIGLDKAEQRKLQTQAQAAKKAAGGHH